MAFPLTSHTVNFTGMVLPPLREYTLVPSLLIGGRITPPSVDPLQVPYVTLIVTSLDALL